MLHYSDGKMIVSDAFFQAASLGVNVLVRGGELFKENSSRFYFVYIFNINGIEPILSGTGLYTCGYIKEIVQVEFSDHVIAEGWNGIISK
ncbi:MAG: hypothetical protein ABNH16_08855 [Thalassolituus sp.]